LNKIEKAIVSMLVIALMSFSAGALLIQVHAAGVSSYSQLPWASNSLVTPGTLTIYGSSTVGPIASEEIGEGNFVNYFNGLITAGTISSSPITGGVTLYTQGSGTAIPALAESTGAGDVGEMSRPPSDGEWQTAGMNNLQIYAVGVDSVAIVVDPTMTWFPTSLTTLQVAQLFADNNPSGTTGSQGTQGNTGSTPLYTNWGDFLEAYYGVSSYAAVTAQNPAATSAICNSPIYRAVRDPTSGTFDCFNNYFAAPNGYTFEHKTSGIADGSEEMAPFTYCQQNINVYETVSAGNPTTGDYIGFISLGYLQTYGGPQPGSSAFPTGTKLIGINIAFNMAAPPSGQTVSPIIKYYGPSGTYGQTPATWGSYVKPTEANVIWAYSGIKGGQATGAYEAWRWLWEVVPGQIPASGPLLAAGVWIAYMMADGTTIAATSTTAGSLASGGPGTGNSNFVQDQNYIGLERDDMAGGPVLDSNLLVYSATQYASGSFGLLPTQTQSYPTGVVNFNDITYFVGAYINYQVNHIYNPYADMDANGVINFNDIALFVGNYIAYYTTWNPP
jgi:hypothetical protein